MELNNFKKGEQTRRCYWQWQWHWTGSHNYWWPSVLSYVVPFPAALYFLLSVGVPNGSSILHLGADLSAVVVLCVCVCVCVFFFFCMLFWIKWEHLIMNANENGLQFTSTNSMATLGRWSMLVGHSIGPTLTNYCTLHNVHFFVVPS